MLPVAAPGVGLDAGAGSGVEPIPVEPVAAAGALSLEEAPMLLVGAGAAGVTGVGGVADVAGVAGVGGVELGGLDGAMVITFWPGAGRGAGAAAVGAGVEGCTGRGTSTVGPAGAAVLLSAVRASGTR
jgi:collagen type IV alpha